MTPHDWLREIAVWSPLPDPCPYPLGDVVTAIGDTLAETFPPEAFTPATVKIITCHYDTFPNYYCCYWMLKGYLAGCREAGK